MSYNLAMAATIECDHLGQRPCRAFFQKSSSYTLRETRQSARRAGWDVNVKARYGRRRLDYCPEHKQ